ncbi:GNAT family N-acetyltransferase [Mangrovibacterium marinum]|uniref:Putative N-acetyltransferase YhbS n=1 Tax=Mangrovibacterium marinum TaxID=1639118 RepID=A0A2T5BVY2_9BACT|nr:N-acetyltransferase [Mangrovibacterium marinum]PTN03795.1 putative N-acetyltransferase YhbS [Mangrovibacterium marinum]
MKVQIRQETEADHQAVFNLVKAAFERMEISEHNEQLIIERLRQSPSFVPELSMVACLDDGTIVGHILLTKITIEDQEKSYPSLVLAPVSVLPDYQHQKIGSQLIVAAQNKALEMGYTSIVLVGHAHYYPRFGYELCRRFGIKMPFDAPDINCMAIELIPGALEHVQGLVHFDPVFFE